MHSIRYCAAGKTLAVLVTVLAMAALGGCGRMSASETATATSGPIALTPKADPSDRSALTGRVNEAELNKAVERYRLTKQRGPAHFDFAAVDLNGDGRSEAVVLFAGTDWCQRTGCSLVVFREEETGYRPVSHVTQVRPPILVGPESSFGWRDLIVRTGGGPAPIRTVRLGFTGKGYPANALLQPEPVADMIARSQQVLAESQAFTAALNQSPTEAPVR